MNEENKKETSAPQRDEEEAEGKHGAHSLFPCKVGFSRWVELGFNQRQALQGSPRGLTIRHKVSCTPGACWNPHDDLYLALLLTG